MARLQDNASFLQALDDNGDALSGALWKTYEANSTTPVTTYSDSGMASANAWPVVAPSSGRWPDIYVPDGDYKVRLETSAGVLIYEAASVRAGPLGQSFVSLADFSTWVSGSGSVPDGTTAKVTSGATVVDFIADSTAAISGVPAGWKPALPIRPEHFAEITHASSFDASTAINQAISHLKTEYGGGIIRFAPDVYWIQNQIVIMPGVTLQGEGSTSPGNSGEGGTTIKAAANLTYMIAQADPATEAGQNFVLRDLTVHGNSGGGFTVGTGVGIRGRQIRVENCNISYCSGVGLHFLNTNHSNLPAGWAWVNWVSDCQVSWCGTGFYNETSDAYFRDNYFTNNDMNRTKVAGGNVWMGNHFDHADIGLLMEYDPDMWVGSGAPQLNDRFIGNYFDLNIQGLMIDGTQAVSATPTFASVTLTGNYYRANNVHVTLKNLTGGTINGEVMRDCADRTGGSGTYAGVFAGIIFDSADRVTISGITFEDGFDVEAASASASMPVFAGRDVNTVQVQNCHINRASGRIASEWASVLSIPAGDTSLTVNAPLLGDIHNVSLVQEGGGIAVFRNYRIANRSGRSFDIEIDSAVGASALTFHVKASMSR